MSGPVPNEKVLKGQSLVPPSITGDVQFGTLVAWSDSKGQIFFADNQSVPPYQPVLVNPDWITFDTPAVVLAADWARVYLAWTDATGAVLLANSGDGWSTNVVVASAGWADSGPALAFGQDLIYVAFKNPQGAIYVATYDFNGNTVLFDTPGLTASSRPSLTWYEGQLFLATGGSPNGGGDLSMSLYVSTDDGWTFQPVAMQPNASIGPPSLAIVQHWYYLAWADAGTSTLNFAATKDLSTYQTVAYSEGCHGGGPMVISLGDGLLVGFTFGAPPEDPRNHHITLGNPPLSGPAALPLDNDAIAKRYARLLKSRAPDPCPDPMTVWDPAEDKCVPRMGCWGQCVLSSINANGLFNPISYALCVATCLNQNK
jgi:hypothetical protein